STPSKFHSFAEFFRFFVPSLTGVVGFWATVSLNIPDFTRYARSQRDQMVGQALGLPATMTFYSFIGIAVTSATLIIFGEAIWDPVKVLARLGNPGAVVLAMIALLMATLNVNVAANVVSPANDFSNLAPEDLYRRTGLYEYSGGFHWTAIVALAAGAGVAFIGLVVPLLRVLYDYAWFVGFLVSFVVYFGLTGRAKSLHESPLTSH